MSPSPRLRAEGSTRLPPRAAIDSIPARQKPTRIGHHREDLVDRRSFVAGSAAAAAAAALLSRPSFAQEAYPSRAITIINPFPPGGASEVVTRPLAAAMEPIIKQPIVIETKAGAAGQVGAQFVAA